MAAALLAHPGRRPARAPLRAAQVEIALARGDLDTARAAAAELTRRRRRTAARAWWHRRRGHRGGAARRDRAADALPVLAEAGRSRGLRRPVRHRRVRVLLARAYRALGDADSAGPGSWTRRRRLAELGRAGPGRGGRAAGAGRVPVGLTAREVEVLVCLAAGRTNREIAAALVISERPSAGTCPTLHRDRVSSRGAATAYAYEHGLVGRTPQRPPERMGAFTAAPAPARSVASG